jgi:hypothetical protein
LFLILPTTIALAIYATRAFKETFNLREKEVPSDSNDTPSYRVCGLSLLLVPANSEDHNCRDECKHYGGGYYNSDCCDAA